VNALPVSREVALHEAYHASALLLHNIPLEVIRIDLPHASVDGHELAGTTRIAWDECNPTNPSVLRAILISLICGALVEGYSPAPHEAWPIDPDAWPQEARGDAETASFIEDLLCLGVVEFGWVVHQTKKLTRTFEFGQLVTELSQALQRDELLLRPEIERIRNSILGSDTP
jgi:hypothetical protein